MEEENQQQVKEEPQQVTEEQQRVTTKDPKKVEAGKRLAAVNHKKKEAKKQEEQVQLERTSGQGFTSGVNKYYRIGAVIAVGVIGGLGYYIYRSKKGPAIREVTMPVFQQPWGRTTTQGPQSPSWPQTNKFEMD